MIAVIVIVVGDVGEFAAKGLILLAERVRWAISKTRSHDYASRR